MDSGDPNSVPYVCTASAAPTKQSLEPHSFVCSVFVYTIRSQSVSDWQIPWAFGEKKAAVVLSQTLMLYEELLCGLGCSNQRETEGEGGERERERENSLLPNSLQSLSSKNLQLRLPSLCLPGVSWSISGDNHLFHVYYASHIAQTCSEEGESSHFSSRQTLGKYFWGKLGFIWSFRWRMWAPDGTCVSMNF